MRRGVIVMSLLSGPDGRIYVGQDGDFGYLQSDQKGEIYFTLLMDFVPKEDRDSADIRSIHATPEGIYFQGPQRMFRLTQDGDKWRAKVWKPATRFGRSFYVFGRLYVGLFGAGLQRFNGDVLETLPVSGPQQDVAKSVYTMLPFSAPDAPVRQMRLGLRNGQIHLLDDHGLRPFPVVDGQWRKFGITTGAVLRDGAFGIGTSAGGFAVVERNGKTRHYLDRDAGIPSDGVDLRPESGTSLN